MNARVTIEARSPLPLFRDRIATLSPSAAAVLDAVAALPDRLTLDLGDDVPAIAIRFGRKGKGTGQGLEVSALLSGAALTVRVDAGFVDWLCDHLLPGWRDETAATLPTDWRAVLALHRALAAAGLSPDPDSLGETRLCDGLHGISDEASIFWGEAHAGGRPWAFSIHLRHLPLDTSPFIAWPRRRLREGLAGLRLPTALSMAGPALSGAEALTLGPGDAVLFPDIGGGVAARLEAGGAARLAGRIGPNGHFTITEGWQMNDDFEDDEDDLDARPAVGLARPITPDEPLPEAFRALALKTEVILPGRALTLAEIAHLGPGASIGLLQDLDAPLRITIGGQRMGTGRLVQIGARLAIQIDTWHPAREHTDAE